MEKISIRDCRCLLGIQSRDTINDYLRIFDWFGEDSIDWVQFRRILELQAFLGLRAGCNSKAMFLALTQNELAQMFANHGIDIEQRLLLLQNQYRHGND